MNSLEGKLFYKILLLVFILLLSFSFSIITYRVFENILFEKLTIIIGVITGESRDLEVKVMEELKSEDSQYTTLGKETFQKYGYNNDGGAIFIRDRKRIILISFLFSALITMIFYINIIISDRNKMKDIEKLQVYLENINKGDYSLGITVENDFTILSDELYKTIVVLRELKENAIKDKIRLKDNIADISHQLKTPITSINIMSELMENSDSKDESKEYVHRLNKQISRLEILTNSLLTMSRLDADIIELKKETMDIKNIIDSSIEPIVFLMEKKNIRLNIRGKDETIQGDSYWLGEAFLNIIKNCVEHLGDGGEINIFLEANPIFTEVKIEDNGDGFLKEDLTHIFERFYKGKNSKKDSVGIGLSMAKTIIEKHNGEIGAENRKEGGARFRIKFYLSNVT